MIRETDTEIIEQLVIKSNINWVEIGVFKAENASFILPKFDITKIYLIDPYIPFPEVHRYFGSKEIVEENKKIAKNKLQLYSDKCIWLEDFSENVTHKIEDESIDVLYIDGNHSYDAVKIDLENYYPKVKNGGLIIGDDYNEEGCRKAIEEFAQIKGISFNTITKYKNIPPTHKFWFYK